MADKDGEKVWLKLKKEKKYPEEQKRKKKSCMSRDQA